MIRDVEEEESVHYWHIVRMRPDLAFHRTFQVSELALQEPDVVVGYGLTFVLGMSNIMHRYLEQIWDLDAMMRVLRRLHYWDPERRDNSKQWKAFSPESWAKIWVKYIFEGKIRDFLNHTLCPAAFAMPYRMNKERYQSP